MAVAALHRTRSARFDFLVLHGRTLHGRDHAQTLLHRLALERVHATALLIGKIMRLLRIETPLGLFALLWALAASLHHLEAQPLAGLPLYPFAILLFLYPERLWAITSFTCAHTALLSLDLPAAANHSVLALLVNGCLLIGGVQVLLSAPPEVRGRRLWECVRGPLQATVVIVYFFAVFHKLNTSFVDPDVSCATSQVAKMFALHGFPEPPMPLSAFSFTIYLTVIVEAAIAVCLLWPRCTQWGVTLGLLFHTGLGWAQFFDFATVVFALYLFFLPWDGIHQAIARSPRWVGVCFVSCLVLICVTSVAFHGIRQNPVIVEWPAWSLQVETLICLCWTCMVWPILLPIFGQGAVWGGDGRWTGTTLAWLIPLLALMNGATSYLGLKTVANYSMFSNLRTEGGQTNHALVPARQFFLADYQDDLTRVAFVDGVPPERWPFWVQLAGGSRWVHRNARWLSEVPGARLPFAEVRRTLQLWRDIGFTHVSITYERQGVWYGAEDAFGDPALMRPLTFWERKLMAFRAVQNDGEASECRW